MAKPSNTRDADRDLECRRAASRRAQTALDQNNARLGQAKNTVAQHDAQIARHQKAITEAKRALAENRQALKALERYRPQLTGELKKARTAAEKAKARATKAEERYERSVLDGLVQREKAADRAAHAATDAPLSGSRARTETTPDLIRETMTTGTKITPA